MSRSPSDAIHSLSSEKRQQLRERLRARGVDLLTLPVFRRPADLEVIPTSFAQQRLWFLDQLEPGNPVYNVPATVRLAGRLDAEVLTRALNEVVRRHDVLRTTFAVADDMPVQVVAPELALELPQTDLSALLQAERTLRADELARQEAWIPFDLAAGPLVRARLLRMSEEEHILLLTVHHIVTDAWSMGVLAREVAELYVAYEQGEPSPLPPLQVQYADYAHWQRQWLGDEVLHAQVDYWKRQLAHAPATSTLPGDRPRPPVQTHRGATLVLRMPAHITAGLHDVAQQAQGTLFMVLAAAFNVLLWRHGGQEDLCIGVPVASRDRAELEPLIGLFVNMLVLRTRMHRGAPFSELVQQVKATTLDAYAHQDVPFEQLVEVLRPQRDTAYSPLFQVILTLQNAPAQADDPAGLRFELMGRENTQSKFDLTLNITEEDEQLKTEFEYNTDLYDASRIERLAGHFTRLLESVIADPRQCIGQLALLDDAERQRVLAQSNGPATDSPRDATIHSLFEAQATRTPEALAVAFEGTSLTYAELNARANRLANFLRGEGVGPDTRVANCVERGVPMVVGLLAILKAGGAYVPLDPDYPAERLAYMLHDCRPAALLTDAASVHRLPPQDSVPVFKVDDDEARWRDLPAGNLDIAAVGLHARHLAYVIYTSGSTGQPKGAMNEHGAVVNRLRWMQQAYNLDAADAVLQKTPFSFDVSVWEFFWPWLVGARLVLARPQGQRDPAYLRELIDRERITTLHFVPSMLSAFLAGVPAGGATTLRRIVCSGEALPSSLVEAVHRQLPQARLLNLYGPTEAAVDVTAGEPRPGEGVTLGRPIANTSIYLLDPEGAPVPLGAPGEIHIGGVQVGRGYLNRPDLTAERFVPDPYASAPGTRMYKTGDLGRWRADGSIEFLGRNDDQVKLRGFRIELGEIEARLRQHADVRDAVVLAREDAPGDQRLVAYVTGEDALTPEALRVHLAAQLPEHMVPAAYVRLDALPLTPNGKLDRRALPAPEVDALAQSTYTPLHTETERAVAAIWSQLLAVPIEHIGREGDFFALGGHSLLAVRVASQVQQALQRTLPLREIFAHRTVRELAAHLDAMTSTTSLPQIEPVPRDRELPLAPVQERLWVVHQLQGQQTSYNMALALQLQGPLSMPALRAAFDALVQRHEPLRTRFVADAGGQPRQVIEPTSELHIPVREVPRDEVPALAQAHAQQVFDLGRAPLLSVRVLRLDEQEHVLLLNMHHIVSDGWSMNVLAHDMQQLYAAQLQGIPAQLPVLGVQYADYAHWLRQQDMAAHAAYWADVLNGYEPGLTLPLDRPAQPRPSAARTLTIDYPADLCASLGSLCTQHGATLFMALTAALGVVLQRYTGRRDLCVGTTVAGRDRAELEPLIGFFINILALRLDLAGDPTAGELLERVKDTSLQALEHQALPFEQVLQQLKLSGDSAQELVPVMVRHQNVPDTVEAQWGDGLTVEPLPGSEQSAKCPLDLQFFGDAQGLSATVEYAADLFDEATVRRLLHHHQQVLQHMVQHPQQPLSLLAVLTAEEQQLIEHCNRTGRELDHPLGLVAQFEQQAQATPDACACLDEHGPLSYAELNLRANRIAHALRERGVGPEVRVGLYMPRSCDFIAAMLGIFKAGGVYVPLDVNAPPAYLQRLIDDAQPQVLMHGAQPPEAAVARIELLNVVQAASQGPETNPVVPWQAQQLMMLAYTSGSTGQPKGVLVPHGQMLNLLRSMQSRLPLQADDVVAQKTMAPFVVSMKELWGALLAGVPQVVVGDALLKDPPAFIAALRRGRVSRLFIVPSHLQAVLDALDDPQALSNLRVCVTAGEPLTQQLRERVQRTLPWVALWNNFGCTELNDTAYCDPEHLGGAGPFAPIGGPIDNVQLHVLDERLRELPLGVVGELCVSYPWMARGYWRQPELTAERFVPNPYGPPGSRLYRTGDMVRRLADGALEYLGREDFDIKIRGQRVDVRQVEAALAACDGVQVAAAGAWRDDGGEARLVAYVVPKPGQPMQAAQVRRELAAQLPAFMVPAYYMAVEALPRTTTGKLDRKSLPAPQADALAQQPYVPPETHTERALAAIWSRFLELPVERIGRDDDFVALGGHSLLATRIAAQVQQVLQRPLQLQDIFAHASLRELAAHVDTLADAALPPPIEPRGHQGDVELSFAQQRLWFLHRWDAQSSAYHNTVAVKVSERLDEALVEQTLDALVRRHEALRTRFPDIDGHAVQRVAEHAQVPIECIDLSDLDEARREAEAQQASQAATTRPFDLAQGPLLRLQLVRLGDQGTLLTLVVHHIVADGWSMDLLIKELLTLYGAFSRQQPDPLPPLAIQYPDYAVWQRRYLQGEVLQRQQQYWTGQLADTPVLLALPTDRPRPAMQSFRGSRLHRRIEGELAERLRAFAQRRQLTPFMVLLSAFNVLLYRYSGQTDIVVGAPVANRHHPGLEQLIGMFANTLALRSRVEPTQTFADLLAQVRQITMAAQAHQDLPFEHLVELLQVPRSTSHSPLFQVMFSLLSLTAQRQDEDPVTGTGWQAHDTAREASQFDLMLSLEEAPLGFAAKWEFNTDLFDAATIERMAGHFERLLRHGLAEPQAPLQQLEMLDAAERDEIVHRFDDTALAHEPQCVHQLIEAQVERAPQAIAAVFEEGTLTYAELNEQANRLAHHLRSLGVGPDDRIAVCVTRGLSMLVALLAVLKAGAAYVPLDPDYPAERLAFTIEDCRPRVVLTQAATRAALGAGKAGCGCMLDLDEAAAWLHMPASNLPPKTDASGLAYVIYTSGSTGTPKGVMVTHANVASLFRACDPWFRFGADDVWTLFHSFAFDFSVWELWGALVHGGRVVIVPRRVAQSPQDFHALLCEQRVTVLNQTPSAFLQLMHAQAESAQSHTLRYVIFGGEALDVSALKPWFARHDPLAPQLINMYGITETTVHVTYRPIRLQDTEVLGPSPIGVPIAGLRAYVLDPCGAPLPIGVAGELHVAGNGLARGYLNRPDLTAERFVPDPFCERPGERMYKSGDLARLRADGSLEYLGRNDHQVKIRGFRIELGEIEARLLAAAGVREGRVVAREFGPGDRRLVAYYASDEPLSLPALRDALSASLPEHMVPAAYVRVDVFPLTVNGKLDVARLPAPDAGSFVSRDWEAPEGEVEVLLATIWGELFGLERVGRRDNFFELGGHSFLAIRLIERMREAGFGVDVRAVFAAPTLQALAAQAMPGRVLEVPPNRIPPGCTAITPDMLTLVDLSEEEIAAIVEAAPGGAANIQDIYPLAPLQEGILFLHLMREEAGDYLWTTMLGFDTRDKLDQFVVALQALIDRHDILRTAMHWDGLAEPVQVVYRSACLPVEELRLRAEDGSVDAQMMERHGLLGYWLDVTRPPLLRAFIAHDAANECWRLQIVLHHLISDHRAINILIEEVHAILHGQPLEPVPPFRNLVAQARLGVRREEHEAFFRDMLSHVDEPTAPFGLLNVPEARTDIRHSGKIRLPTALGERLRRQARELKVSVASLFHLAWARLLSSAAGRDEVVFGTFMFGRLQGGAGADRMPGMFINILPICIRVGGQGVADAAREAHALLTQLVRHEHAPLPLALRCSGVQPPKLLFSAVLNYRHGDYATTGEQLEMELDMQQVDERNHYPFTLMVDDMGDGFLLNACTSAAIDPRRVYDYTQTALEQLVDALESAAQRPLAALDVLPPEERALVAKWSTAGVPHGCELVHRRIATHARRMPEQIAVEHHGQRLSYAELDSRAERLAGYLRAEGVGPEVPVGICVERSIHLIVGLLAILKAGGAYVPLDPAYPQERLAYIVKDSGPAIVLAMPATAQAARSIAGDLRVVDLAGDVPRHGAGRHADDDPEQVLPQHVAYAIYTSGSTGVPKGVQVTHGNLASYVEAAIGAYALQPSDRVLQFSSLNFDLSVEEIFATLGGGATLVLAPWSQLPSIAEFHRTVESAQLTMLTLPTAYWHEWAVELRGMDPLAARSLRLVVVGGERVLEQRYREWHAAVGDGVEWINTYGPTEATVIATLARASGRSPVHIGRPISGTTAYILDARNLPVPPGAPGELCIGGAQVARGYRNRPDLTAERFVPDPFDPTPGARMYRTGDRARYRDDGTIEYLGRFDDQVKLRGFRVEPEEIRAVLARLPWVREALVTVREGSDHQSRLVAYVVQQPDAQMPPLRDVRDALARTLPPYMVPAHVVCVPRLPLTPNGKIDRKALPAPEGDIDDTGYVAPRTEIEEILCGIWSEALNVKRVGVQDSFFDLGGHSLLALQVMSRLGRRLEREVPVHLLFANPTVAALARRISEIDTAEEFRNRVTVRMLGSASPLFIIHAGDGEVGYAFDLAPHLPEQHPVYALAAIGFAEGETPLSSVQAMAASYLRAIRSVQPYGPYQVLGWSAGGMIAYEIAAQLLAAGESVSFVGVIDTLSDYASILGSRGEGPTEAEFFERFARGEFGDELADQLTAYVGRDDIDAMLDLCQRHGAIDAAIERSTLRRHLAVRHAIALSLGHYRPQPIAVPLTVYTAVDEGRPDPRLGWNEIAEYGLDVVELPGTHWTIVDPSHIGALGLAISQAVAGRRGGVEHHDAEVTASIL